MIELTNVDGIIFDLDGTLVDSTLNFSQIKRDVGCPSSQDVLEFIANQEHSHQQILEALVVKHEIEDAQNARWLAGAQEFVDKLTRVSFPMAIVTRNCREATKLKLKNNNIPIDLVITREDAPPKPAPDALLSIASQWEIGVGRVLYIGDYIYDEQAAHNAGMQFEYAPWLSN